MPELTVESIVVGVDVHKYTHTAVALDCLGNKQGELTFSNDELDVCIRWLSSLGSRERLLLGLEDTNGYGLHLAKRLADEGFSFCYVPPVLTDRMRSHAVHKDKSDALDAKRVGKVILHKREETLPAETSIPQEKERVRGIDLLLQERHDLIKEQTRLKNQLHMLLHQHYGNGYRKSFKDIFSSKALEWHSLSIKKEVASSCLTQSILRRITRLKMITAQIKEIDSTLKEESKDIPAIKKLHTHLHGCGPLTACKIIAEVVSIKRFDNRDKLAKYAGIAPVRKGTGKTNRVYTNPAGNRKLNHAIHTIALSQIGKQGLLEAQTYYQKKLSEGKSKLWALRCLKRQIINRVFDILAT